MIIGSASYHRGDDDKPAILLLHGFLQTRDFFSVKRLYDALASNGYTLLSPTLSLGLSRRPKSLPCESIHTNSIDDDISEIERWVGWLAKKSGKPIIVIGHSMGATEVVAFLEQYRGEQVIRTILISIAPMGPGWPANHANHEDEDKAQKAISAGKRWVSEYGLAYCKNYVTTARSILSFYSWDYQRLSSAIAKLSIPVQIIIGSEDTLIDTDLIQMLASQRVGIELIEGAGHFFDQEFEFELHDAIESHLSDNW